MTIQHDSWTILPLRKNDIYIMDAVADLGLTTKQLKQINACQMYLQITTLAKMTDHTGDYLLPHVLNTRGKAHPLGLDTISCSTLQWPCVCNLTTTTWNFWTKTISILFTGSAAGSKLQNPLGKWTSDYATYRFWKWRLGTTQRLLHKKQPSSTPRVALQVKSQ